MTTKYEIIEVNKVTVSVDVSMLLKTDDMFFNATEIAKQFDKKPSDFWKQQQNKEYLNALITLYGGNKNSYVRAKTGKKYGGTWFHKDLALQFARWCSAEFAVKLDKWVVERINQEHQWKLQRLTAKTGYLPMTNAIEAAHDDPKFYHYSNEADLINRIVFGMSAKKYRALNEVDDVRSALTELQLKQIEELQLVNTGLIKIGMDFDVRKEHLTTLHERDYLLTQ